MKREDFDILFRKAQEDARQSIDTSLFKVYQLLISEHEEITHEMELLKKELHLYQYIDKYLNANMSLDDIEEINSRKKGITFKDAYCFITRINGGKYTEIAKELNMSPTRVRDIFMKTQRHFIHRAQEDLRPETKSLFDCIAKKLNITLYDGGDY
jgi:Mor family transcriptional regulator